MSHGGRTLESARETCSYCPKLCRHACPAALAEGTEQSTPTFKQQVALQAASGQRPLDADRARVLYACSDCAGSVSACRHRIDVGDSLLPARAQAVAEQVAPREVTWLAERFAEHGAPYARDLALDGAPPAVAGAAALLPACTGLAHDPHAVRDALTVLDRIGRPLGLARPAPTCCGYPLLAAGHLDAFKAQAARFAASVAAHPELVVQGPACAHTLAVRYREVGVPLAPTVTPLVDVFAAGAGALKARRRPDPAPRVAYHDPCFLARRLRRTAEPRAALGAVLGQPVLELGHAREATRCSGGGGVFPLTHPASAHACAEQVIELADEITPEVLVTACPSARRRLALAAPGRRVVELPTLLAERTS